VTVLANVRHVIEQGNLLIIVGAAVATIWLWTVVMTPIARAVVAGVVLTQIHDVRSAEGPR
jgi:hypothetical protein